MYKYLLFAYNMRFGGKGGMNDLTLKFNSFDEVKINEILLPTDPTDSMYSYKYQLVNTENFSTVEFTSKSGYEREGEDRKQITRDRIKEISMWLVDAVVSSEKGLFEMIDEAMESGVDITGYEDNSPLGKFDDLTRKRLKDIWSGGTSNG